MGYKLQMQIDQYLCQFGNYEHNFGHDRTGDINPGTVACLWTKILKQYYKVKSPAEADHDFM